MRNNQTRFSANPATVRMDRSTIPINYNHLTTFNAGKLIPLKCREVLAGDSVVVDISEVVRMGTPLFPVMDSAYLDVYAFYVPFRQVWSHWKNLMGESTVAGFDDTTEYFVPIMPHTNPDLHGDVGFEAGGNADHFGIPTYAPDLGSVSALPFRALRLIWNEYFRDENLQQPKLVNMGDIEEDYSLDALLPVAKLHDAFTSALPWPQKGDPVLLPLQGNAPIITGDNISDSLLSGNPSLTWYTFDDSGFIDTQSYNIQTVGLYNDKYSYLTNASATLDPDNDTLKSGIVPSNLYSDLSQVTGATINQLRQAFAVQRLLERDALGGTRYRELLKAHFSVSVPDLTVQIPEYLGGHRKRIGMQQVVQTSGGVSTDFEGLGNVGGLSVTTSSEKNQIVKSFSEPGMIIYCCCVRNNNTYQQGLEPFWWKRSRYDFYWPELAHIGEQPIPYKAIYAYGTSEENEEIFGYQEAWYDYRYCPNSLSGEFRSNSDRSLDAWHYADYYDERPSLSAEWIESDSNNIGRTLAVTDTSASDQFIASFRFNEKWTRVMPVYSIPGLVDHY